MLINAMNVIQATNTIKAIMIPQNLEDYCMHKIKKVNNQVEWMISKRKIQMSRVVQVNKVTAIQQVMMKMKSMMKMNMRKAKMMILSLRHVHILRRV